MTDEVTARDVHPSQVLVFHSPLPLQLGGLVLQVPFACNTGCLHAHCQFMKRVEFVNPNTSIWLVPLMQGIPLPVLCFLLRRWEAMGVEGQPTPPTLSLQ